MTEVWLRAALWLGLALAATLISIRLRVATALSEIVVGTVAQLLIGAFVGTALLGTTESWITFLSATGAVFLTFLAGAELDPAVLRTKWRETGRHGSGQFCGAVSRLLRVRALRARVVFTGQLAVRRGAVDDVGRRRVRGDARTGSE
jgi:Kef-type K+ transport system membrane component KefB